MSDWLLGIVFFGPHRIGINYLSDIKRPLYNINSTGIMGTAAYVVGALLIRVQYVLQYLV